MKIIRKRLYALEGLPGWQRWSVDDDVFQQSYDGGNTWIDSPGADPRVNPGGLAPPNTETDPRCAAAAGMRNRFEQIMEQFWLAETLLQAANAVFAAITIFNPPASILWRVIFAICEAIYALGSAALLSAFSGDTFDLLQCVFYNNIGNVGIMTDAQLSDVNTEICADFDVTVCAASGLMLRTFARSVQDGS